MTGNKIVNELLALHASGRMAEMETRARIHLKAQPGSALLNELLGIALTALRRPREALPYLDKAVRRQPDEPQFRENLALCLRELKDFAGAEEHLRKALALRPRSAEALNALGSVLRELDRPDEAETAFEEVLALDPGHPGANFNLAKLLLAHTSPEQVAPYFERAVARNPSLLPQAHYSLGVCYRENHQFAQAEAALRSALALTPDFLDALIALVRLLNLMSRKSESVDVLARALAALGDVKRALREGQYESVADLAATAMTAGRISDAVSLFRALREFDPTNPELTVSAYYAARQACDWDFAQNLENDALAATRLKKWTVNGASAFSFLFNPAARRSDQLAAGRCHAATALTAQARLHLESGTGGGHKKLRIGYLSSDFRNHAVAFLVAGALEAHDHAQFEIFGYDNSATPEEAYSKRLRAAFDFHVPVLELSDRDVARRIAEDGIDIVVDLEGWTGHSRSASLAARPAPIQMQWLGYPGTMGAAWIDYIVADSILIRPGEEGDYSEKVIRLPHSYQPNDRARKIAPAPTRIEAGLPALGVVFCSFNQSYKLTPDIVDLWLGLLGRVDGSVLWLLEYTAPAIAALRARVAAAGLAADRVIFAPTAPNAEHLARTSLADVALDCFPYGGHTTASDALWAGVPFVALAGDTFASRVSSSLLNAFGLPELITTSRQDYFDLALKLAQEADWRAGIRSRITSMRETCALFDTKGFTRDLETAFTIAADRRRAGLPPDHFNVVGAS